MISVTLHLRRVGHATIVHMNVMNVPFHLLFGSLICSIPPNMPALPEEVGV